MDQEGHGRDLAGAHDRVVEEACRPVIPIGVVHRRLIKRVADAMGIAAVHLALDDQLVDRLPGVVSDDIEEDLDLAGLGVDSDHGGMAAARVCEGPFGVEALEYLQAFRGNDLGDRDALRGRASNGDVPVLDHEVRHVRLEHIAGALEKSPAQRGRGLGGRVADLDGAAAAGGQRRRRHVLGVRGGDADPLERPTQPVGSHLRGHRLMALPLRGGADEQLGRSVFVDPELGGLATTESGRLDTARDSKSDQPPVVRVLRHRAQLLEREVQQPRVVTAVVDQPAAPARIPGREGDLFRLDKVASPQLDRGDVQRAGELIHCSLDGVVAERPPAATNEPGRHCVCEHEL